MAGDARDLQREPYTEEELAAIWVDGGPPKLTEPIKIVDYDRGVAGACSSGRSRSISGGAW